MINDLTTFDSGSYQLRVDGWTNRFMFTPKTIVSVKALSQKPKVMIPPLTEGQQATLTCTAPGFCSGSPPKITWMWERKDEIDEINIPGSITASLKTENQSAVTQRHSSTLTFNPSAKHHKMNLTCLVSVSDNITTKETVTLNVTLFSKILKGSGCVLHTEVLSCVCISEGSPLPSITWPLLKYHTEYSIINTVSNHTVNSTLTVTNPGNISVECISSNKNWAVKENLAVYEHLLEEVNHVKQSGSGYKVLPWVVAGVSLSVNVFCMIYMWHLWNTQKKVKPTEDDKTYMSLQKPDISPEYDVIVQRPH
ncbi:hypothetical protein ILYODFUR_018990 [Ilyodon furcidens]|uniref:Ig-like domain-containing protein n=1 Tax=Ilyodon furcidens TaxID=33524 RepID=A0ABV0VFG8_9TELE